MGLLTRRLALALALVAAAGCGDGGRGTRDEGAAGTERTGGTPETTAYGPHPEQVGDLHLPAGAGPHPVVVLLHGGFWLQRYGRDLMEPLARDLAARGWAVYNLEYRRVGGDGGWPETFADVAQGVDHLATLDAPLDLDRLVTVGHSAGGHLALWVAGRHRLPAGAVGADPGVRPCAAVGQAAVGDLVAAAGDRLGGGAIRALLGGGPAEVPDRYAVASPAALVPLGIPLLLVHGEADRLVPPSQSRTLAETAGTAGDVVELATVPGGHFIHLDVGTEAWAAVTDWLAAAPCG